MSTNHKRPREASPAEDRKRRRSAEGGRDHRDGHLHSGDRGHRGSDRRQGGYREHGDRRDDGRRDSRRGRSRERSRDRDRERDRERDRDRRHDHGRDHGRGGGRGRERSREHTRQVERPVPGKDKLIAESEKEEGEISPRHSASSRTATASPRPQSIAPPKVSPPTQSGQSRDPAATQAVEEDIDILLRPPSPDPEKLRAERRAKRQSILAKYASQPQSSTTSPLGTPRSTSQPVALSGVSSVGLENNPINGSGATLRPLADSNGGTDLPRQEETAAGTDGTGAPANRVEDAEAAGVDDFSLVKDGDASPYSTKGAFDGLPDVTDNGGAGEQVSAADYDPSDDRREDEIRRARAPVLLPAHDAAQITQDSDDYDMFAVGKRSIPKVDDVPIVIAPTATLSLPALADSGSDEDGYYRVILGELLDGGRYQVFESLGKGMFSGVVRARVLDPMFGEGREVAIKVIRAQETMYKAGLKEVQILNKLMQADPDDKKHLIRLERTFEHRGHLCLVFESLSMNLRDVIKRFGKDIGLNIKAVRAYAQQMFLALTLMKKCNILHADLKPDNILVNDQKTVLKICDLGSASDVAENEITPYLVSRFYRAPEIILGMLYDPALDVWSIGCTLYELFTGKILFPGRTNNHMLLLMMELKGRFNNKMIKKARFGDVHFDEQGAFLSVEKDKVTGGDIMRKLHISKPTRDLRARLMPNPYALAGKSQTAREEEIKIMSAFIDLLDKCLALDPARRITPKDALAHPFLRS